MEFVPVRHPGIEGVALVPESAVAHWRSAGWVPADDQADDTASVSLDTDDIDTAEE